ncbi:hypothetical protein NXX53_17790 [Bacteroides salyersiae]|nr:hypothetical protein [Bacteroides salyersiae]
MYTQVNNQVSYGGILPILNNNVIKEDKKKAAIQGYGHGCLSGKVFKMRTLLGK